MAKRFRPFSVILAVVVGVSALAAPGCVVAALVGGMARSYELTGSTLVPAQYTGLEDRSYAVVVIADRIIQSEHPAIVGRLMGRIDAMLYENAGASQHIPADRALQYMYDNPRYRAIARGELGEELGVERLIVVELTEYTLTEAGNPYVWAGTAAAAVEVYETDAAFPDDPVFEELVAVGFPDREGLLKEELAESAVTSVLSSRLCDRVAWLFFDHEEANVIPY